MGKFFWPLKKKRAPTIPKPAMFDNRATGAVGLFSLRVAKTDVPKAKKGASRGPRSTLSTQLMNFDYIHTILFWSWSPVMRPFVDEFCLHSYMFILQLHNC